MGRGGAPLCKPASPEIMDPPDRLFGRPEDDERWIGIAGAQLKPQARFFAGGFLAAAAGFPPLEREGAAGRRPPPDWPRLRLSASMRSMTSASLGSSGA